MSYAGWWRRFAGYLIDGIILGVVNGILTGVLKGAGYGLGTVVNIGYFTYLVGSRGQTLGQQVMGIRVVDADSGQAAIGYTRAFIRWIGYLVSALVLLLGFLWPLWDSRKQGWMDKMARTVVVTV